MSPQRQWISFHSLPLTNFTPLHFVLDPLYSPLCLCNNSFATFACASCLQKLVFTANCSFFHCSVFSHTSCYAELVAVVALYTFLYTNKQTKTNQRHKTKQKTTITLSKALLSSTLYVPKSCAILALRHHVCHTFCSVALCLWQWTCTLSALQCFVSCKSPVHFLLCSIL